jgi:Leucine-rich repeat (LRR) protein
MVDENVKILDLSQQNLTEIPVEIWKLTPKVLLAHLNNLTHLPAEIEQLTQLTKLN